MTGSKKHNHWTLSGENNIEAVISAPLIAASKANAMMISGQARFLLDYCFTKNNDDTMTPIMVTMKLTQGSLVQNGNGEHSVDINEMSFQVPLLCLLPINSLAVDSVNVDFALDVTSVSSYDSATPGNAMHQKAALNVKLAKTDNKSSRYHEQKDSHLKVSLTASTLPLPKGVLELIDLYTKTIQPVPAIKSENKNNV